MGSYTDPHTGHSFLKFSQKEKEKLKKEDDNAKKSREKASKKMKQRQQMKKEEVVQEITIPAKKKLSPATEKASKENWERLKAALRLRQAKKRTLQRTLSAASNAAKSSVKQEGWEIKGFSASGVKPTPMGSSKRTTPGKTYRDVMGMKQRVTSYSTSPGGGISRSTRALHSTEKTAKAIERLNNIKSKKREVSRPKEPKAMRKEDISYIDNIIERLTGEKKAAREKNRVGGEARFRNRVGSSTPHIKIKPGSILPASHNKGTRPLPGASKSDKRQHARNVTRGSSDRKMSNRDPNHSDGGSIRTSADILYKNKFNRPARAYALRRARHILKKSSDKINRLTGKNESFENVLPLIEKLSAENKAKREASRGPEGRSKQIQKNPQHTFTNIIKNPKIQYNRGARPNISQNKTKSSRREFSRNAGKPKDNKLTSVQIHKFRQGLKKSRVFTARNDRREDVNMDAVDRAFNLIEKLIKKPKIDVNKEFKNRNTFINKSDHKAKKSKYYQGSKSYDSVPERNSADRALNLISSIQDKHITKSKNKKPTITQLNKFHYPETKTKKYKEKIQKSLDLNKGKKKMRKG